MQVTGRTGRCSDTKIEEATAKNEGKKFSKCKSPYRKAIRKIMKSQKCFENSRLCLFAVSYRFAYRFSGIIYEIVSLQRIINVRAVIHIKPCWILKIFSSNSQDLAICFTQKRLMIKIACMDFIHTIV